MSYAEVIRYAHARAGNGSTAQELRQVEATIRIVKRSGVKPSKQLLRYCAALERLRSWERKRKLAETKQKKYRQIVKRYYKVFDKKYQREGKYGE